MRSLEGTVSLESEAEILKGGRGSVCHNCHEQFGMLRHQHLCQASGQIFGSKCQTAHYQANKEQELNTHGKAISSRTENNTYGNAISSRTENNNHGKAISSRTENNTQGKAIVNHTEKDQKDRAATDGLNTHDKANNLWTRAQQAVKSRHNPNRNQATGEVYFFNEYEYTFLLTVAIFDKEWAKLQQNPSDEYAESEAQVATDHMKEWAKILQTFKTSDAALAKRIYDILEDLRDYLALVDVECECHDGLLMDLTAYLKELENECH